VILHLALWIFAVVAVPSCLYLLVLTLLSAAPRIPRRSTRLAKFNVIVPAHNEAAVIERTVRSLTALDWPKDRYQIVVIADNCTDTTADIARRCGARVLERRDHELRGKGYALAFAFEYSKKQGWASAVVIVDADTSVTPNLLEACATRIEGGSQAIQIHYAVLNPADSWRTRLMAIALAAFHTVRSRARARLGLSCGIRGNGWCVTPQALERVPYRAFSLAEDVEFGVELGMAGIRVDYAEEAIARGEMVSAESSARKQRQRWEQGRFAVVRNRTIPLLVAAIRQPSRVCLDLAFDLLVLPLSYVACSAFFLLVAAIIAVLTHQQAALWLAIAVGCCASLTAYVLRGWTLSGVGVQGLWDFARVPGFVLWKMILLLPSRKPRTWVRTDRRDP
jgi:cellulose synthase/poly-beta-1,6-N-acetylglucosamine synthase-like glycosyltransferase